MLKVTADDLESGRIRPAYIANHLRGVLGNRVAKKAVEDFETKLSGPIIVLVERER